MTNTTRVLLAQLRQHIGGSTAKRKSLYRHCCEKVGRTLSRGTLHKIVHGQVEPGADLLIPVLRWLQLEGVIVPEAKADGLFAYTRPLRAQRTGLVEKKPQRVLKPAAKRRLSAMSV